MPLLDEPPVTVRPDRPAPEYRLVLTPRELETALRVAFGSGAALPYAVRLVEVSQDTSDAYVFHFRQPCR